MAVFVALAMVVGGGGAPSPGAELLLQLIFAGFVLAWIWMRSDDKSPTPDPWILALVTIPLLLPIVQLIPLPPFVWTNLPGREDELASLSLVGAGASWQPISLSTSRTVTTLLAMIPATFVAYGVASLNEAGRKLVLKAIILITLAGIALGVEQVVAGRFGFNFYEYHHSGWVTGFHANRNHEADVILIGFLALTVLASVSLAGQRSERILGFGRQAFRNVSISLGLMMIIAAIMTGSRTGILLIAFAFVAAIGIVSTAKASHGSSTSARWQFWPFAAGPVTIVAAILILARNTAVERVLQRFIDLTDTRGSIWQDGWFAAERFWPVGVGMGGFQPAIVASERLEAVGPGFPNRAHNDYLELAIEAGALGLIVLLAVVATCLILAARSWRASTQLRPYVVFGLGTLFILAMHSIVDYPMRTMAIACLAGVAGGMLVKPVALLADRPSADDTREMKG